MEGSDVTDVGDTTWIYDQLGLSPEAYKGDRPPTGEISLPFVRDPEPRSRPAVNLDFDYDALRPGDPHDSPFPPGSLGSDDDFPKDGPKAKPFDPAALLAAARRSPPCPTPPRARSAADALAEAAADAAADIAAEAAAQAAAEAAAAKLVSPAEPEAPAEPAAPIEAATPVEPGTPSEPAKAETPEPTAPKLDRGLLARALPEAGASKSAPSPAPKAAPHVARTPEPVAEAPVTDEPIEEHNPFWDYDRRQEAGEIELPTLPSRPDPEPIRATDLPGRSWEQPVGRPPGPKADVTSEDLTADKVLKSRKTLAAKGWRRAVKLGPGAKELKEQEYEARVRTPIQGCHRLAVISLKGGVGKTTTAAALGTMFAAQRGDRVIAVDANPDRGTLGEKIVGHVPSTVRDFVGRSNRLEKYSDVRRYTAQADSRLEVLASEPDPMASMAFSEHDYRVVSDVLEKFYNLILTDCGTGLLHSAMVGVLAKADQVVIVSSASLDGARSASATLDWLEAHGYQELARDSVSVISSVRPKADGVQLGEIEAHFASRTRAVVSIPYDSHLAEGGRIDLTAMSPRTYDAFLHLAAEVGDAFARVPGYKAH